MKTVLSDTDFSLGSPEAWDPDERKNLRHRFLPISQYTDISESNKIFLCGRRGSGKSAIALMLENASKYKYSEAIQGEVEEYGTYMDIVRAVCRKRNAGIDIDVKKSIRRLWIWALPVKAMQIVLKQSIKNGGDLDCDLETIWNYLTLLPDPIHEESTIGHLLSNIFQICYDKLSDGEDKYEACLLNLSQSKEYRSALKALHRKTLHNPALLVLDTLESYRIFEAPMIEALKGILEAVNALRGEKNMEGVFLKFFMPAEIYDTVFEAFPGKIQSSAVFLRWSSQNLISMLARRYLDILIRTEALDSNQLLALESIVKKAYQQESVKHVRDEFWYESGFLPRKVPNRLGNEEDCFAYMFRHSQRRPRDVLAQMQAIVTEARKKEEFPYVSVQSVVDGVHNETTLQQILGDALTPYEGKLPGELSNAARTVFYQRERIMNGRELRKFANELYNLYPLESINPHDFVHALLRCGVIGFIGESVCENGINKDDTYSAKLYNMANFEYVMQGNLPLSDRFYYCVHPVMGDIFKMSAGSEGSVIYPLPDYLEGTWLEEVAGIIRPKAGL